MEIPGKIIRTCWIALILFSSYSVGTYGSDDNTFVPVGDDPVGGDEGHRGLRHRGLNPLALYVTITYDTFEDGTGGSYTRVARNGTKLVTGSSFACQGNWAVLIPELSHFRHANVYQAANYVNFRLSFKLRFSAINLSGSEAVTVAYTQDSVSVPDDFIKWTVVKRFQFGIDFTTQNSCNQISFEFFTQPTSISQIRLRFKAEAGKDDNFYIDDILFEGIRAPATPSPTPSPTTKVWDRSEICPRNRTYPTRKYKIQEYTGPVQVSGVEDDLSEISGKVFTTLTDTSGSRYAYVASDKNQFSLKVIKFDNVTGVATTNAVYKLNIPYSNSDWEEVARGPCSNEGAGAFETCIYIANIGNNNRGGGYVQRKEVEIYKFREPAFTGIGSTPVNRDIKPAIITYNYKKFFQAGDVSGVERFDAEAMFVDWTGTGLQGSGIGTGMADIYVVLKGRCKGVGRISASVHKNLNLDPSQDSNKRVNVELEKVMNAAYPPQGTSRGTLRCDHPQFRDWHGADMSRNGRLIAMLSGGPPARVHFFPRLPGQTVVDALSVVGCDFVAATSYGLVDEKQYEAVAFVNAEGTIFAETSECNNGRPCKVPLYMHRLVFKGDPPTGNVPPPCEWKAITYDDFEPPISSLGATNYITAPQSVTDPDAALSNINSCKSTQSVRLRWHNGGNSSIFHSSNRDCSAYSYLRITFQFRLAEFDHMDALFLELSLDGGIEYFIINSYAFDVDDITANGVCYRRSVVVFAGDFNRLNFGNKVRLRFRTSASEKAESVFIDDIRFEGHSGAPVICV